MHIVKADLIQGIHTPWIRFLLSARLDIDGAHIGGATVIKTGCKG